MESLALVVTLILLYSLVALVVMVFTWRRPPRSSLARAALIVFYVPAIYIGVRLSFQDIALPMRTFGGAVVLFGVLNLFGLIRRSR